MQLVKIVTLKGQVLLKSGLHIGAGDLEMHIGGTDNPVVKNVHSNEPYIPGSSLKGKVRSLLEMRSGLMAETKGNPVGKSILKKDLSEQAKNEATKILKIFGSSGADADENDEIGPTRASFADCYLSAESRMLASENNLPLTEVKSENSINRISGTAVNPRFTERVLAGLSFDFSITLKELDIDSGDNLIDFLLQGLKLLEYDALGGSGSRGYGRVEFDLEDPEIKKKFSEILPISN
ncbi:MAG: type III-A CRISPR-associated RAMP protein Csm3 [Deltaproteobacteria bacterium]|nr:MAG: type III-A CRISPR-associated RAMP protein Csm3 [Deltaproteobacteria bacterium]